MKIPVHTMSDLLEIKDVSKIDLSTVDMFDFVLFNKEEELNSFLDGNTTPTVVGREVSVLLETASVLTNYFLCSYYENVMRSVLTFGFDSENRKKEFAAALVSYDLQGNIYKATKAIVKIADCDVIRHHIDKPGLVKVFIMYEIIRMKEEITYGSSKQKEAL